MTWEAENSMDSIARDTVQIIFNKVHLGLPTTDANTMCVGLVKDCDGDSKVD